MDSGKKLRAREKKVVSEGKGVEIRGEGLGTGPVGNTGQYTDRDSIPRQQTPVSGTAADSRRTFHDASMSRQPRSQTGGPGSSGFSEAQTDKTGPSKGTTSRNEAPAPFSQRPKQIPSSGQQRASAGSSGQPASSFRNSFGTRQGERQNTHQGFSDGSSGNQQHSQQANRQSRTPGSHATRQAPGQIGNTTTAHRDSQSHQRFPNQPARSSGRPGRNPLLLIILAVALLLGGGGSLSGLFGGGSDQSSYSGPGQVQTSSQAYNQSQTANHSQVQAGSQSSEADASFTDLLTSFLGSGSTNAYDFTGFTGSGSISQSANNPYSSSQSVNDLLSGYFTTNSTQNSSGYSGSSGNSSSPDTTVASGARAKYTTLRGSGRDTATILVYMCGTDLESQNGMGTSDLKEMAKASLDDQVNLIIYTGGCSRWRNSVISSAVNQIYQIRDGGLYCLESNMGSKALTSPSTLSEFIRYGAKNFPADRTALILWDHGGGSISGYGYDEKIGRRTSMTLDQLNTALKDGGIKFDFIGFDACLMATLENGLMLSSHADYMIASEETEPGVGWYYTNWLNRLSENTSMPTVEIGKLIADDYVSVCARQCRGQSTTLSVVDLAELESAIPQPLKRFSKSLVAAIQKKEYKSVSTARSKSREFAQSSKIDQVDIVHFATNLGTPESAALAKAVQGAVKYNRIGGGINQAYGLSIYFPYRRTSRATQAVSTFQAIGMDDDYTRCVQEFASLEISGQVAAGTSSSYYNGAEQMTGMNSLFGSLLGAGGSLGSSGSAYSYSSSAGDLDGMTSLFGSLFSDTDSSSAGSGFPHDTASGSSFGDLFALLGGRSMTPESTASYIYENHFDPSLLVWESSRITLPKSQWDLVESLNLNVFYDNGSGFVDLGTDPSFTIDGDALLSDFDGTWLSIDRQPVAWYYLDTVEEGENYAIQGYIPCFLNGVRANLLIIFDSERPGGYIAGARKVYREGETNLEPKSMIAIGAGDELEFICDYYDYEGHYQDSYHLGKKLILGDVVEIANTPIDQSACRVTYRFTDIYQQNYWTPVAPF